MTNLTRKLVDLIEDKPTDTALFEYSQILVAYEGAKDATVKGRTKLVAKELAETLRRLAAKGPPGFYRGPVAEALVAELEETPIPGAGLPERGIVTLEDLAAYEVKERDPLIAPFQGYELITMPPPSSTNIPVRTQDGVVGRTSSGVDTAARPKASKNRSITRIDASGTAGRPSRRCGR